MRVIAFIFLLALVIFLVMRFMKNRVLAIFIATFFLASIVRGLTGVSFNPFFDEFKLVDFLADLSIWTVSYLMISLLYKKLREKEV